MAAGLRGRRADLPAVERRRPRRPQARRLRQPARRRELRPRQRPAPGAHRPRPASHHRPPRRRRRRPLAGRHHHARPGDSTPAASTGGRGRGRLLRASSSPSRPAAVRRAGSRRSCSSTATPTARCPCGQLRAYTKAPGPKALVTLLGGGTCLRAPCRRPVIAVDGGLVRPLPQARPDGARPPARGDWRPRRLGAGARRRLRRSGSERAQERRDGRGDDDRGHDRDAAPQRDARRRDAGRVRADGELLAVGQGLRDDQRAEQRRRQERDDAAEPVGELASARARPGPPP